MPKKRKDGYLRSSFTFKKKRYYVYGRTRDELFEKEKEKKEELENNYDSRINPTLEEYYQKWRIRREGTVSDSTMKFSDSKFNTLKSVYVEDIKRRFVDILIRDITIDDLIFLQRHLLETGRMTSTVNDCVFLVKRLLTAAEHEQIIKYNPGKNVKDLKRTEELSRDTKHRALSHEEQTKLFDSIITKKSTYYNVYRFALLTGMRVGEIGALKLSDIKNNSIYVQRTLTKDQNANVVVGKDAKTKSGRRTIPLTQEIKKVISDQREYNKKIRGNVIDIDDLLFKLPKGGYLTAREPDRELKKICKEIGIDQITMHGFRATFATRCIESGMNPRTLQEILGHKDFAITMNLYGHVLDQTKKEEMDKVRISI